MTTPFELLGLPESATPEEVKSTWRQLAAKHHPDRGGDAVEFNRLRQAYNEAVVLAAEPVDCKICQGRGKVAVRAGFHQTWLVCLGCGGSGTEERT